ncbi:zinc finger cchc domain-containing protein [Anaeramoeba flamelloides]|uniref:Zinc finger cchc domain-containing protein n=1 Tax=Anaeramoeba flamelloides TaxID=1746091 RepID=A0AAV7Z3G9_9EUKA|nr:zinc finger cchc domain-containing protein [Anaeramoeba flamelloides]
MSYFVNNLKQHKIEVGFHFLNLFGWLFSISAIGSFGFDIEKYWSLYTFVIVITLFLSLACLILIGKESYGDKTRYVLNHVLVIVLAISLLGAQAINDEYCLLPEKCLKKSVVAVFGISVQLVALGAILICNIVIYDKRSEYQSNDVEQKNDMDQNHESSNENSSKEKSSEQENIEHSEKSEKSEKSEIQEKSENTETSQNSDNI